MYAPATTHPRLAAIPQVMEETWDLYLDRQFHSGGYSDADAAIAYGRELLGEHAGTLDPATMTHTALPETDLDDDVLDPLTPYAGAPDPAIAVTMDALQSAHDFFACYYADEPKVVQGAAKALAALRERAWAIQPDGALELCGSTGDTYLANDQGCTIKGRFTINKRTGKHRPTWCKSFVFGQKQHGGQCYHLIARELLRLAQLMQ
jgi:hypothetical protein